MKKNKTIMGIDLSINSIGISLNINNSKKYLFYIILPFSKMTKKIKEFNNNNPDFILQYIGYEKIEVCTVDSYHEKESTKMNNFVNICNEIEKLIDKYNPDEIQIEGIAYGTATTLSIIDLSGLNYMLRILCRKHNIPFYIISPSELKKFATGYGNAHKDLMISGFLMLFPELREIKKIDDVADAYYLSLFKEHYYKVVEKSNITQI